MNWKITRPNHWIEFRANEPFCQFFPIRRNDVSAMRPTTVDFADAPDIAAEFAAWTIARNKFHSEVDVGPPKLPKDKWEKHYFQGNDQQGVHQADHQTRLRLNEFTRKQS